MKRATFSVLFLMCFSISGVCQITPVNKKTIKTQILKKTNQLRIEVGVKPLVLNPKLEKSAEVQSFYMSKNEVLTHSQKNPKFDTPQKRIEHFSPIQFDMFGENVLLSKTVKFPLSKTAAIKLANEMFNSWKNSPEHYANMIEKEFDSTNFGFNVNKRKQIYATNVFGRAGVKIENQLSENHFGLLEDKDGSCFDAPKYHSNILVNIGNAIRIEGNEVVFYYHDKKHFFNLFSGEKDGIAVDIIDKTQLSCESPNLLDISPIHDGILLKPVYRNELLKNNQAESDYRLISPIGLIPDHLLDKDLTLVVLLIKNGVVCKQVIPSYVPSASYPLKPLEVNVENPETVSLSQNNQIKSVTIQFDFNANQTSPIEYPKLPIESEKVLSVEIKSFSSVEGNEKTNVQLHNKRAKTINQFLSKSLKLKPNIFKVETKENWDEFNFQLKYHFLDTLLNKSKEELRIIASNRSIEGLPWDSLLFEQRKSVAIIYYKPARSINKTPKELFFDNLRYAIINDEVLLAKKALREIYLNENENPKQIFEEAIFESILQEMDLVQNTAAVLIKFHEFDLKKSIKFINKWLISADKLSPEAKFNLLNLYTIVNNKLLDKWDLPSKRLANVINPKYVSHVSEGFSSNELMLNLHLTFIKYFGQTNDGVNISKSFNFISSYFSSRALKMEDMIALSKFYNRWSMYKLTNDYLLAKFKNKEINEDAIFLLLETLTHFNEDGDISDYDDVYQKGIDINQNRWCKWVSDNIQLLRDSNLKKLYCEKCK